MVAWLVATESMVISIHMGVTTKAKAVQSEMQLRSINVRSVVPSLHELASTMKKPRLGKSKGVRGRRER